MRSFMALHADASPETPPKRKPLFRHPFRRKTLKPRTGVLYIAGAAALFAARPEAALFFPGLVMILVGQSLRAWATGYLLKTDELTTAGPYAHLRHPLYAGSLLMGCGFALVAGKLVAMVVVPLGIVFYFGYYLRYKERVESERLEAIYGDDFRANRANVPALFPRLTPWYPPAQTERPRWRLDRVIENDEQTALVYTVLALATFAAIWWYRAS
jgi:protein-S-isoprenylcysteine O-methyltransferase Ste14